MRKIKIASFSYSYVANAVIVMTKRGYKVAKPLYKTWYLGYAVEFYQDL